MKYNKKALIIFITIIIILIFGGVVLYFTNKNEQPVGENQNKQVEKVNNLSNYIYYGDIDKVRELIKNGINVNESIDGLNPLIWAVSLKKYDIAEELILAGADVNIVTSNKETALIVASKNGDLSIVNTLISSGADIKLKNNKGEDALMTAVIYSNFDVVNALILFGADVNTKDNDNKTALMAAVERGNTAIIQLLKKNGAIQDENDSVCDSEFMNFLTVINSKNIPEKEGSVEDINNNCITIGPRYNDLIKLFQTNNNLIDNIFELNILSYFKDGKHFNLKKEIKAAAKLSDNVLVDGYTSDGNGKMVIIPGISGKDKLKKFIENWIGGTLNYEYQIGYQDKKSGNFIITHIFYVIQ